MSIVMWRMPAAIGAKHRTRRTWHGTVAGVGILEEGAFAASLSAR